MPLGWFAAKPLCSILMIDSPLRVIEAELGPADFSREGVRLYRRDCLEAMRCLPPGIVNLTVTSPPYNIGKEYERLLALSEYLDWCKSWICEVHRITRPTGAFWLNLGYVDFPGKARAIPLPYLLWESAPFYLIQEIVWAYGAGVASRLAFSPRNEKFLWYVKNPAEYIFNLDDVRDPDVKYPFQKKNGKLKCNPLGKNPGDVWAFPKVTSGKDRASPERTAHPAQFPVAVINRIVRACSNSNDLVMDPFSGSGSTCVVALVTGRQFVGFEISEKYFHLSVRRIEDAIARKQARDSQVELFGFVQNQEL